VSKFKVHDLVCVRNTNGHTTGFIADVIEPKRYLFYSFIKCKYLVMEEEFLEPEEPNRKFKKGDYLTRGGPLTQLPDGTWPELGQVVYAYPQGWYLIRIITVNEGKYLWWYRHARPDSGRYWTLHEKKKEESEE
jgi:hypothetical protein